MILYDHLSATNASINVRNESEKVDPRAAKYRAFAVQDALSLIHVAAELLATHDIESDLLRSVVNTCRVELDRLSSSANVRIESRHRRKEIRWEGVERPKHILFLDECGSHALQAASSNFPVFCLCGVIIEATHYRTFDDSWKAWKQDVLGHSEINMHEPEVRHRKGPFRGNSRDHADAIQRSLSQLIDNADFTTIAAVIDLRKLPRTTSVFMPNGILPASSYLMAIDFVLERFLHYLHTVGGDGTGMVVAESRGVREDAIVHAEYQRLKYQGTQFVSDQAFRYHLEPAMEFLRKTRNSSGLQLADLAARPLAERTLDPTGVPLRWDVFKSTLYDGGKNEPWKYGLKVFPLEPDNDPFPEKATGASSAPVTD